jgi:integrase
LALDDHAALHPAASKTIGYRQHQLAHVPTYYSTLLHANGKDPKVVQELLRHSSVKVTMDVYTQAVTATKRKAQSRVVEMIVPKKPAGAMAPA